MVRISGFFFFKQKTAYEMRISDWSSDVCSSDLHCTIVTSESPKKLTFSHAPPSKTAFQRGHQPLEDRRPLWAIDILRHHRQVAKVDQIGSASCRERVCQYV